MQRLALTFAGLALLTGISGYALTRCAIGISQQTGLSQTATGGLLTAVVTSLPELVTSIAAVRRGALTLAVGGIIGGNAFDVPFLAFADVAYRQGSLYEALNPAGGPAAARPGGSGPTKPGPAGEVKRPSR